MTKQYFARKAPRRANPDFFTDSRGTVHPIRNSRGYVEWLARSPRAGKMRQGFLERLKARARARYT